MLGKQSLMGTMISRQLCLWKVIHKGRKQAPSIRDAWTIRIYMGGASFIFVQIKDLKGNPETSSSRTHLNTSVTTRFYFCMGFFYPRRLRIPRQKHELLQTQLEEQGWVTARIPTESSCKEHSMPQSRKLAITQLKHLQPLQSKISHSDGFFL